MGLKEFVEAPHRELTKCNLSIMKETFHALIFFSELQMFKAVIAAFICFKLLKMYL